MDTYTPQENNNKIKITDSTVLELLYVYENPFENMCIKFENFSDISYVFLYFLKIP